MTPKAINVNSQAVATVTAVGVITIFLIYWYHNSKKKSAVPTVWEPVGKVSSLHTYPLKSGRRVVLQTALCTKLGFRFESPHLRDRCLMLYKESDLEYRTARTYPKLLLISATTEDDRFIVTTPGMETLVFKIPLFNEYCNIRNIKFEKVKVRVMDCGDEAAQWFSRFILGTPTGLRLGFGEGPQKLASEPTGIIFDIPTYLIINQASVNEVAGRVPDADITVHHFRPNIVVEGSKLEPYSEDHWDWVRIGEVIFRYQKSCTRCSMVTVDPETGLRSKNFEPITTMKRYRMPDQLSHIRKFDENSPVMGVIVEAKLEGTVSVGDEVYVGRS